MSLKLLKRSNQIELLQGTIPENQEIVVFTEDEVLQFEGWKQWMTLTEEQREDMMMQTQSAAYQEWLEEEDWEECRVEESPADYGLQGFKA